MDLPRHNHTETAILGGWTTLFEQWERKWVLVPWEFAAEPGWEFRLRGGTIDVDLDRWIDQRG